MNTSSHDRVGAVVPVAESLHSTGFVGHSQKSAQDHGARKRSPQLHGSYSETLYSPFPIRIFTLGRFSITLKNQTVDFCGKGQRKALELLKTLIAFGGREIGEVRICEALWPDSDGDVAHTTFSVTLHRLRKLLGNEALILSDGRLTLNATLCWVDVWSTERLIGQTRQLLNSRPIEPSLMTDLIHKAVSLYHGPYLGNEDEQPWFLSYRQRLHTKLMRTVLQVCRYLEQNNQYEVAINLYEYGIEIDDLSETTYLQLMKCYFKQGKYADAVKVYQRCNSLLQAHYGIGVSHEMRSLHQSLKKCA